MTGEAAGSGSGQPDGDITWIASYPKSGNTWVRFIVAALLRGGEVPDSATMEALVPDVHRSGLPPPREEGWTLKTHWMYDPTATCFARSRRAIHILRNPLDVFASGFDYGEGDDPAERDRALTEFLQLGGFARCMDLGMGNWEQHLASWTEAARRMPVLRLRYEELLTAPEEGIRDIARFLGLEATAAQVARIAEATSFAALRRLEERELAEGREGFFLTERREKRRADFRFLRRGGVGRHRERLEPERIERLLTRFGSAMERAGYRREDFAAGSVSSPDGDGERRRGAPQTQATVVYVAVGDRYLSEAAASIASVRRHLPEARCIVYTDRARFVEGADEVRVEPPAEAEEDPFLYCIRCLRKVPEERFLFLDTDTLVVEPIDDLFPLLERFDFAAAHAPIRLLSYMAPEQARYLAGIPESFPEFNSGVMLIRRSAEMARMFARWEERFREQHRADPHPWTHDQPALREAVYRSRLAITVLPPEYNFRLPFPTMVAGPVRILHGRHRSLGELGRHLNAMRGPRAATARHLAHTMVVYSD